jgi:hypothetical protein
VAAQEAPSTEDKVSSAVTHQKKQGGAEERRREEYRKKQAEIEKLQKENMMAMYPELYAAGGAEPTEREEPDEEEEG